MVKRRCVFLDRDGVINTKGPEGRYVCDWEEFQFIPEIVSWIRLFNALNLLVIVVTNQRGVAKGLMTHEQLDTIHNRMLAELAERGAIIDDVFVCPHESGTCNCRKPLPGMVWAARDEWEIDLSQSLMIGDSAMDRKLAENCGMTFVGVRNGAVENVEQNVLQTFGKHAVNPSGNH